MKIQAVGQKNTVQISGVKEDGTAALFQKTLKQNPQSVIRTVPGGKTQLSFTGSAPDRISISESFLSSDGTVKGQQKTVSPVSRNHVYTITVEPAVEKTAEGTQLLGFCVIAYWGNRQYQYPFLVRTDPSQASSSTLEETTRKVRIADFQLSVPANWKISESTSPVSAVFQLEGKKIGSVERLSYDPSKPVSQFFEEGWKVLSSHNLENRNYPTTEVFLRKDDLSGSSAADTSTSSSQASSNSSEPQPGDELHFFILSENSRFAYDLSFNPTLIDEKSAAKIAQTLDLLGYETVENVGGKLKTDHPEIEITNEFVSEDFGTAVLFGSLKSDPEQGVAVVIDFPYEPQDKGKEKTIQTPEKHGSIRAVSGTSAKPSIVTVKAKDGYEWSFDIYNGFSGGNASSNNSSLQSSSLSSLEVSSASASS